MKMKVKLHEKMTWVAASESGHAVVMDASPQVGGQNLGMRPMEMMLAGLGGCTGIDVMMVLRKKRQDVTDCEVVVTAERAETMPRVFTKIHVHYIVTGRGLKAHAVGRAVEMSAEVLCSASKMLGATAEMSHDFECVEVG